MLTPAEIKEVTFPKMMFNGYEAAKVDDFLERVQVDYAAALKEIGTLKQKLKVLVEKVEEYRQTEDEMRASLADAKRRAEKIIDDSRLRADEIAKQSEAESERMIGDSECRLSEIGGRYKAIREQTDKFTSDAAELTRQYLYSVENIDKLRASAEQAAKDNEDFILARAKAKTPSEPKSAAENPPRADAESEFDGADEKKRDDDFTIRPKFDFDDLKFGDNYKE